MKLRDDPEAASEHGRGADAVEQLQARPGLLGRRPSDSELYMAHFMGVGGAAKLIANAEDNPQAVGARLFPQRGVRQPLDLLRQGRPRPQRLRSLFGAGCALRQGGEFEGDAQRDGDVWRYAVDDAGRERQRRAGNRADDRQRRLSPDLSRYARGDARRARHRQRRVADNAPSTPVFRSIYQPGDATQPVSTTVQKLWGNNASLTSVASATPRGAAAAAARSLQRSQRHVLELTSSTA